MYLLHDLPVIFTVLQCVLLKHTTLLSLKKELGEQYQQVKIFLSFYCCVLFVEMHINVNKQTKISVFTRMEMLQ